MNKNNIFVPRSDSSEYLSFKNLVNELHQHLQDRSINNNTFTISNFKQYEPLFNKELSKTLSKEDLIQLAKKYFDKIDPYMEIRIVNDNNPNELLFTLPPLFLPLEKLSTNPKNLKTLENINTNDELSIIINFIKKLTADFLAIHKEKESIFIIKIPKIKQKLKTLKDVGLGYITLGQNATTLSGGEAQRIKLAKELSKTSTGNTIYLLDEPTTGLHFDDIKKLLKVLQRLVTMGNTIVVIEHNLDVIKCADYVIDLGLEGGDKGGEIVATGTPEDICENEKSYTGKFLKSYMNL